MAADKIKAFVAEYIIDLDQQAAAIRAGYSPRSAKVHASRLMARDDVQELVQQALQARAKRTEITADKTLLELAKLGFSQIDDYLEIRTERLLVGRTEDGEPISEVRQHVLFKDTSEIPKDKLAAISEVKQNKDGSISFKLHDKKGALDSIGKHLGMFVDKHELTGKDGGAIKLDVSTMTDEQLQAEIAALKADLGVE